MRASQNVEGRREDVSSECVVETQFCSLCLFREGMRGDSRGFSVPLCVSSIRRATRSWLWHLGQVGDWRPSCETVSLLQSEPAKGEVCTPRVISTAGSLNSM